MAQLVHDLAPGRGAGVRHLVHQRRGDGRQHPRPARRRLERDRRRRHLLRRADVPGRADLERGQRGRRRGRPVLLLGRELERDLADPGRHLRHAGQNIGSYEAPAYRPTGRPVGSGLTGTCMDFDPGGPVDNTFAIALAAGRSARFDFQWGQPRNGVTTDLDIYAVRSGDAARCSAPAPTDNLDDPEAVRAGQLPEPDRLNPDRRDRHQPFLGRRDAAAEDRRCSAAAGSSAAEYDVSFNGDTVGPTIFGHNGAANAVSTAAVPFDDASSVEPFSSAAR